MLTIKSLDQFRQAVKHKEEIREAEIAPNLISFCYMISAEGTFDSPELRECRGIVFDKETGAVVGRPLHKFFNVGERPETREENLPSNVVRQMDKRDGSMIHTVKVGDSYRLKSKKSFESDVAVAATKLAQENINVGLHDMCVELTQQHNCTAIFEYTAPDARIVLPYKRAELRLLHIRHNVTGRYWSYDELTSYAENYGVGAVDEICHYNEEGDVVPIEVSVPTLLADAKVIEGIEGWIIQFTDGDMVKIKTDWYLLRHRAMTFLRERDIAQLVLDEGIDDVKSMLVADGVDINDILQIEQRVVNKIIAIRREVDSIILLDGWDDVKQDFTLSRKDFAIKYKDNPLFGLLMSAYQGKEPSYKEWFERNVLRQEYELRQLVLMDSNAEVE